MQTKFIVSREQVSWCLLCLWQEYNYTKQKSGSMHLISISGRWKVICWSNILCYAYLIFIQQYKMISRIIYRAIKILVDIKQKLKEYHTDAILLSSFFFFFFYFEAVNISYKHVWPLCVLNAGLKEPPTLLTCFSFFRSSSSSKLSKITATNKLRRIYKMVKQQWKNPHAIGIKTLYMWYRVSAQHILEVEFIFEK